MTQSLVRFVFTTIAILLISSSSAIAQTTTDTGGTSTSIGQPTTTGEGLNADAAFSQVERGATIGATGDTGSGFSDVSASNQGGTQGTTSFGGFGGGFGGLGGLGGLFGGFGNQTQNSKPAIRTRLRSAIAISRPQNTAIQQQLGRRFRTVTRPSLRNVNISVEDGRATLTGVVANERDRRMSELLLRLEPGVNVIDNQLEVSTAK